MDNPSAALTDARSSFNKGDYDRAINLIKIYSSLSGKNDGKDLSSMAERCRQYLEKARLSEERGDSSEAIKCYKSVLEINPNDINVKNALDAVIARKGYVDISKVTFANTDNDGNILIDYGGTLYKEELRYVTPKIYYNSLSNENKSVEFFFKIYNPDGKLRTGSSSPSGYTWSDRRTVYPGNSKTLIASGWGNSNGGAYSSGRYLFEIWCNGSKLYSTSFEVKSRPQVSSSNARSSSSTRSSSRAYSSNKDFFLFQKPEENYPDMGFIFGLGNLTTIGAEFNGNVKSFYFGVDAAVCLGEYASVQFGDTLKGGAFLSGSLGYRTQYWGAAMCLGNQWVSSMVDGKETVQSAGIMYGPKLAIYPIPRSSRVGVALYLSYMIVPGLSELNGFKFGIGFRM